MEATSLGPKLSRFVSASGPNPSSMVWVAIAAKAARSPSNETQSKPPLDNFFDLPKFWLVDSFMGA
jgi:hypothetical protein